MPMNVFASARSTASGYVDIVLNFILRLLADSGLFRPDAGPRAVPSAGALLAAGKADRLGYLFNGEQTG